MGHGVSNPGRNIKIAGSLVYILIQFTCILESLFRGKRMPIRGKRMWPPYDSCTAHVDPLLLRPNNRIDNS